MDTARAARTSFDLKSASLAMVAMVLRTTDTATLASDLAARMAGAPGFFDNDPVLIDLSLVQGSGTSPDFAALLALLRSHRTVPVAVRGGSQAQTAAALAAGLVLAPEALPARAAPTPPAQDPAAAVSAAPDLPAAAAAAAVPSPAPGALVVDKPLRSGQQVYARGSDLVVLAMVSFGAEVIADGSIHVYAPLRGRAMAGARGNTAARIFTTCMEPQLVSIAGIYRTTEVAIPPDIVGKPAQVRLEGEKLFFEPL